MQITVKIFFFIMCYDILLIRTHCELTSVINIDSGPVQGEILKTVRKNIRFAAFRGIPYGKPPIGSSRFMPPERAESWTQVLNATSEATPCPQMDPIHLKNYIGNEDCLNLNVYTPITNFVNNKDDLLAVMVWLYGGRYTNGYTNITYFGPDYLIENNVVIVAMNFRLGALGYLALNHTNATGNAALKDQRLAFEWVKRNINLFGGNPNEVTIFGESTGGTSVDFHILSDRSRGLFHRSISMSASALCAWALSTVSEIETQAFELGRLLGICTNNTQELLTKLYDISAEQIIRATSKLSTNLRPFKPTIENVNIAGESAIITEYSMKKFMSGNFSHLSHMTGYLDSEVLLFYTSLPMLKTAAENVQQQTALIMNDIPVDVISKLSQINGGLPSDILVPVIDQIIKQSIVKLTDILYVIPIDIKQQLMQKYNPVYYYKITIAPNIALHKFRGFPSINAAIHGDDIAYLWHSSIFKYPTDPNDQFTITRDRLVRMWTNFAKYSDPTPLGMEDYLLNVTWPVSGVDGEYLEINNELFVNKQSTGTSTDECRTMYISNFEKFSECT